MFRTPVPFIFILLKCVLASFHTTVSEGKFEVNNNPNFPPLFLLLFYYHFVEVIFHFSIFLHVSVVKHNQITAFYNNRSIYHKPSSIVCNDGDKIQSHFKSPIMVVREDWIYPQVLQGYLSFLSFFFFPVISKFILHYVFNQIYQHR